jgi:copper(I)-binding protein
MEAIWMKKTVLLAAVLLLTATVSDARDYKVGSLEIQRPWTRATPQGARVAAGYLTIVNRGGTSERLLGGSFAGATSVEVHSMSMENGVMRMRPLAGGLEVKPGETVELKPNSFHLMFLGLKQRLQPGQAVRATLSFEHAGSAEVEFAVEAMGASGPMGGHGH